MMDADSRIVWIVLACVSLISILLVCALASERDISLEAALVFFASLALSL